MSKLIFAIDLLWVRYGAIGGGVSVALNLLEGLSCLNDDFEVSLVITSDNEQLFSKYLQDPRFKQIVLKGNSKNRLETVLMQNFRLAKVLDEHRIPICLEPDNYLPIGFRGKVSYVTVIHDLQAIHYPENFSKRKLIWLHVNWRNAFKHSRKIVAISDFTKQDIVTSFGAPPTLIDVIYDPVVVHPDEAANFEEVARVFGIAEKGYYYTMSSMARNKNLSTIIVMMALLKARGIEKKLVVSGISNEAELLRMRALLADEGLSENVVFTGFVDDSVRDCLCQHCEAFLFPSVFEGFGMPPIEASLLGARVITTKESCISEVTQNALEYVDNPFDAFEWAEIVMQPAIARPSIDYTLYDKVVISAQYLDAIRHAR